MRVREGKNRYFEYVRFGGSGGYYDLEKKCHEEIAFDTYYWDFLKTFEMYVNSAFYRILWYFNNTCVC